MFKSNNKFIFNILFCNILDIYYLLYLYIWPMLFLKSGYNIHFLYLLGRGTDVAPFGRYPKLFIIFPEMTNR